MRWLLACLLALVPAQETGVEPDGAVQLQLHRVRDDYVDLLIVVPSEAKEVQERRLIRDSWGKYLADGHCKVCGSNRRVKLLFGLGARTNQSLQEEKDWADVAVLSLDSKLDSPNQQAMKTRILIAHAVEKYDFGLLLKVDPHSFVFLDRLLSLAEGKKLFPSDETPDIYGGYFAYQDKQVKKMEGKLKDLDYRKLTGHNRFPKYAKGAGYLLSRRLCRHIANFPEDNKFDWAPMPALRSLSNEDVSVGFWLQPVSHWNVQLPVATAAVGCKEKEKIIDHPVPPEEMTRRGQALAATGDPCAAA
ncbi:unnamed protein product [Durusdinium trenchii]|uniref:Hexosyltransferase n=1 Tax=Durusdinium trenchii TaxID=1381693 RepID=A0ABP0I8B4_9DINO